MKVFIKRCIARFRSAYYSKMVQDALYNAMNLLFILLSLLVVVSGFNLIFR